jgi:two-component system response regulator CpxR
VNKILIIDDDAKLCALLSEYLSTENFLVDTIQDGKNGLETALNQKHDLIVLDVMLPGINGFEVLRSLREKSAVPVLMLTARGDEIDRIVGMEMGSDDYLAKPINPRELVARIRAILRRVAQVEQVTLSVTDELCVGDLCLNIRSRSVFCGKEEVKLTGMEFSLLEYLVRNSGEVVSRDELTREVLGKIPSPYDRSLDVHISNLRKKLAIGPIGLERIKAIRGAGYLYSELDA